MNVVSVGRNQLEHFAWEKNAFQGKGTFIVGRELLRANTTFFLRRNFEHLSIVILDEKFRAFSAMKTSN